MQIHQPTTKLQLVSFRHVHMVMVNFKLSIGKDKNGDLERVCLYKLLSCWDFPTKPSPGFIESGLILCPRVRVRENMQQAAILWVTMLVVVRHLTED